MAKSKKGLLLEPKLTVLLEGKSEEEIPINGKSVLSSLHDIAKYVVTATAVDQKELEGD